MRAITALFASSRPVQALLSVVQPLFAALLALGGFPNANILALIIIGGAAGMFSVFALNDLLDYEIDRKNIVKQKSLDVDSLFVLHPLSRGLVTKRQQAAWIIANAAIAAAALYILNPAAIVFFGAAILLEYVYCRLALRTDLKTVVAGALVSDGALIGWIAARGAFNYALLLVMLMFFAWEIGGRNIPNDFSDVAGDKKLGMKTVPLVHGLAASSSAAFALSIIAVALSLAIGVFAGIFYLIIAAVFGVLLMILPALSLFRRKTPGEALGFFNKASIYPIFLLIALAAGYVIMAY